MSAWGFFLVLTSGLQQSEMVAPSWAVLEIFSD